MKNDTTRQWNLDRFEQENELTIRDWLKLSMALGGWIFLALIGTSTAYIAMQGEEIDLWLDTFVPMSTYYLVWALAAPVVYRVVARGTDSARRAVAGLAMHGALLVAMIFFQGWLLHPTDLRDWLGTGPGTAFIALAITIYLMVVLVCIALKYYRRALDRDRAAKHLLLRARSIENDLNRARLDMISTQFRPHFLFNALNGITALIETANYDKATDMVHRLGQMLRATLVRMQSDETTLAEEIEFVTEFVELQRLRAAGDIALHVDLPDALADAPVPPMILQPLVENSIKFAERAGQPAIRIEIDAGQGGTTLYIRVKDNGEFHSQTTDSTSGAGYGLSSITRRLTLHYGDNATVDIGAHEPAGTVVTLELPYDPERGTLAA